MIGIYCGDKERVIVQEFFELFKTPWEFFNSSRTYDVVVSTQYETPEINANLIIIYSSASVLFDVNENIITYPALRKKITDHQSIFLPVYGDLSGFKGFGEPLIYSELDSDAVAIEILQHQRKVIRVGFDLFREIAFLLSEGQPVENALFPTLDSHISIMRGWILAAGIPLIEIPPIPFGYNYFACLTHDIDFVGIRRHKFDHTMWGFIYRGLIGSLLSFFKDGISLKKLVKNWAAVFRLPFVYAGFVDDFWMHFDKYAEIDTGFGSTFFIIPFKDSPGDSLDLKNTDHHRRAAPYGIIDIENQITHLMDLGFEIGLHGIDAWHSPEKGAKELNQVNSISKEKEIGIRMHWLYYNSKSPGILENIGFNYDASLGYNETIGFKNGTMQVFRPLEVTRLLEIPLNIQDTSLFYPRRLALKDADASRLCKKLLDIAGGYGGVLTLSWHDRSLEPERLWGDFYIWLLQEVRTRGAWMGSAYQIVRWFRQRRSIVFEESGVVDNKFRLRLNAPTLVSEPKIFIRFYAPCENLDLQKNYRIIDIPLNDKTLIEIPFKDSEVE